jgi:hypothetical protein
MYKYNPAEMSTPVIFGLEATWFDREVGCYDFMVLYNMLLL